MVWNNAGEFLHMGGYAPYVWGSVGVTSGLMLIEVVLLRGRRKSAMSGTQALDTSDELDHEQGEEPKSKDRE